jgi:hypothetical protein
MPKAVRDEAQDVRKTDGYEGRYVELGGYTVGFEKYTADADLTEMFKYLPDGRCQCPHWGVVLKGTVTYRSAEGEMNVGPGEAYYAPAGHVPHLHAGTEVIEFSPTKELHDTMRTVAEGLANES